jgi:hypothetical protein
VHFSRRYGPLLWGAERVKRAYAPPSSTLVRLRLSYRPVVLGYYLWFTVLNNFYRLLCYILLLK